MCECMEAFAIERSTIKEKIPYSNQIAHTANFDLADTPL